MGKGKNDSSPSVGKYILISLLVLIVAMVIGAVCNLVLPLIYGTSNYIDRIIGMLEGIIGAIAAGLVLFQLKAAEKTEQHQNDIEEASFILQYNQAFIQDANMVEVERLLEDQAYYDTEPREILNADNRQKYINYLVYLESLAPLVLNGVLSLEHIDNLMAYRFFLAVDNVELQEKEILPFAEYYRGCFKLYRVWRAFRKERGIRCPCDDCTNADAMRSLEDCPAFETYSA